MLLQSLGSHLRHVSFSWFLFPKKRFPILHQLATGSDVDLLKSESSVLASQPQNDIRASFLNPSPKNCQKVVDELTDGKNIHFSNIYTAGRRICHLLSWRDVCGVATLACFVSSPDSVQYRHGWRTVHPMRIVRSRAFKGQFVYNLFRHWQKKSKKFVDHQSSRSYQHSLFLAGQFCLRIEHPEKDIAPL